MCSGSCFQHFGNGQTDGKRSPRFKSRRVRKACLSKTLNKAVKIERGCQKYKKVKKSKEKGTRLFKSIESENVSNRQTRMYQRCSGYMTAININRSRKLFRTFTRFDCLTIQSRQETNQHFLNHFLPNNKKNKNKKVTHQPRTKEGSMRRVYCFCCLRIR